MTVKIEDIYKIAAHHRFQWEKAQNCYVILFPEGMVKLNGGAGEVLNLVDGKSSVAKITEALVKKFPDADSIDKDIIGMIELALEKAWIEKTN
ncbi:pyrroloquinoline quinone biosynthesis peptide chaperone PqqD [Methylophilaceae bacterium]|jgi:pyrroloquinoline quinone biosynthesis protein D|nr:pyrroloquinoline quinone biosynthesis peptide chaperone PqqD [Betaproteobacteria bacterium]MDB2680024.1 pyrroloquinoline quinone biosynthesis peptide chaperone PqqD [Methylophilaceae bacterium]